MNIKMFFSEKTLSHTECIGMGSLQYESSYASEDSSSVKMNSHSGCIDMVSHQYELLYPA